MLASESEYQLTIATREIDYFPYVNQNMYRVLLLLTPLELLGGC